MHAADYPKRRHMVLHLGIPEIAALIDLPDDVRIHRVISRENPDGMSVVLESPRYDEVDHMAEAPYLYGATRNVMHDDEGRVWVRWSVE